MSKSLCLFMTDEMILIKKQKTWQEALDYCREHHYDLVSITNPTQQKKVEGKYVQYETTGFIWLGLRYTSTLDIWFWVNGEVLSYDNWNRTQCNDCNSAAAMGKGHKWFKKNDTEKFNFICVE